MYHASIESIPDGRPGLRAKIARIRELVEQSKRDPAFRARVLDLVRNVPEKDYTSEIDRVVEFVRKGIRYTRDPWSPIGLELFVDPRTMLRDIQRGTAAGDCDDHVLLASAMLELLGHPTRYRVGGLPPDIYRHIWIDVRHPTRGWLPVELTRDWPVGKDPSPRFPLVETYSGLGGTSMLGDLTPHVMRQAAARFAPHAPRAAGRFGKMRRDRSTLGAARMPTPAQIAQQWRGGQAEEYRRQIRGMTDEERARFKAQRTALEAGKSAHVSRVAERSGFTTAELARARPGTYEAMMALGRRELGPSAPRLGRAAQEQLALAKRAGIERQSYGVRRAGPGRRFGMAARASRRPGMGGLGDFGDALPPSAYNTHTEQVQYWGSTPAEHLRAEAIRAMFPRESPFRYMPLLGDDAGFNGFDGILPRWEDYVGLSGPPVPVDPAMKPPPRRKKKRFGRKLEKIGKKIAPIAVAVVATVATGNPAIGAAAGTALHAGIKARKQKKAAARAGPEPVTVLEPQMAPEMPVPPAPPPTMPAETIVPGPSLPVSVMSSLPGPSFVEAAQGFALPPGVLDQVAISDRGAEGYAAEHEWEAPLPGAGRGSWIPTPPPDEFPNAPAIDPFDTPATEYGGEVFPGFGQGYGTAPWETYGTAEPDEGLGYDMHNHYGSATLGAETWLSQLGKTAAQGALAYEVAKHGERVKRKYGVDLEALATPFLPPRPPVAAAAAPPPVLRVTPPPAAAPPPIYITAPRPPPPPQRAAAMGPGVMIALGLGVLALLMAAK